MVVLYFHFSTRLHGVVLNELGTGATLPLPWKMEVWKIEMGVPPAVELKAANREIVTPREIERRRILKIEAA
jgi:hypothetical protein